MSVGPVSKQLINSEHVQRRRAKPPGPVMLVALFQFAKAAVILSLVVALWRTGEQLSDKSQFSVGQLLLDIGLAVLVAIAGAWLRNGIGLLRLDKASRRRVMWNIVAGWSLYGISFTGMFFGQSPFVSSWPFRILGGVLLVDLFLYCCLAYYPDVARAFGDTNDTDFLP